MDNQMNAHVPDFIDISSEATQAAAEAIRGGIDREPLTPPDGAGVFYKQANVEGGGKAKVKAVQWYEPVTIEWAERKLTGKGTGLQLSLRLRVRATSPNAGRTVWGTKFIKMEELQSGELSNYVTQWIVQVLVAADLLEKGAGISGKLINLLFPTKGQPGVVSPLVGKSVKARVYQYKDFYNGDYQTKTEASDVYASPAEE